MAFYLVKEKEFQLSSEGKVNGDSCARSFIVPASVEPAAEDGSLSERDCALLKVFLNSVEDSKYPSGEFKNDQQYNNLEWNLHVTITMNNFLGNNRDFVRVTGAERNGIFRSLTTFLKKHELKIKIAVKLHKFSNAPATNPNFTQAAQHVVSFDSNIEQISSSFGSELTFSGYWDRSNWDPAQNYIYKGAVTIRCILYPATFTLSTLLSQKRPTVIQKILEDEIHCDVTIIAKGGICIRCHKPFLSAQSPVFRDMLKGEMYAVPKPITIEISEMTENGVKALLAYLYLAEDDKAERNCKVALELLQASHTYKISPLQEYMKALLLSKPDSWYKVDAAVKIFQLSRKEPALFDLKKKTIKILKRNFAAFKASPSYEVLFMNDPYAAMEFCELAISI